MAMNPGRRNSTRARGSPIARPPKIRSNNLTGARRKWDYSYDQQRYAYRLQDPRYGDGQPDRDYGRDSQPRYEYAPNGGYRGEQYSPRRRPDMPYGYYPEGVP